MNKTLESEHSLDGKGELPLSQWFVYTTVSILVLLSLVLFFTAGERLRLLGEPDVLLGVSNRTVLVLAGLIQVAVSGYVFAARSLITQSIVLLWLGLNYFIYRVGLVWMGVIGPPLVLQALGLKLGARPATLDAAWKWLIAYVVLGSVLVLVVEWRRLKRERAEEFMKRYREKSHRLNPENGFK